MLVIAESSWLRSAQINNILVGCNQHLQLPPLRLNAADPVVPFLRVLAESENADMIIMPKPANWSVTSRLWWAKRTRDLHHDLSSSRLVGHPDADVIICERTWSRIKQNQAQT